MRSYSFDLHDKGHCEGMASCRFCFEKEWMDRVAERHLTTRRLDQFIGIAICLLSIALGAVAIALIARRLAE